MAKELPYYQFEVAEYLAGDIMICSLEAQGLFSIIKCIYWQKECSLNISKINKRYNKIDLVFELQEEGAIKIDDQGEITINFLDSQYQAFKERRNKLSVAGKKGGLVKKQATLKPPLSDVKATQKHIEEKRGEESIKKKQLTKDVCDFFSVNEMKNFTAFKMLNAFVSVSGIDTTVFNAYKEYKHTSKEKIHGWQAFIGSQEKQFSDGAWASCDWTSKIKANPISDSQKKANSEGYFDYSNQKPNVNPLKEFERK